jgi:hypothetical protein
MRHTIILALVSATLAPTLEAQTLLSESIAIQNTLPGQDSEPPIFNFENGPEFEMSDFGTGADTITIQGGGGIMLLGDGRVRLITPTPGASLRITPSRNGFPLPPIVFSTNDLGELEIFRPTPDVDRDGRVTGKDMRLLLSVLWRVCICREDANQDGVVNIEDIRYVGSAMGIEIEGSKYEYELFKVAE